MKTVLVLGAGLVTRPLVRYLLDQPDFKVIVASRTVSKAVKLIDGHEQAEGGLGVVVVEDADVADLLRRRPTRAAVRVAPRCGVEVDLVRPPARPEPSPHERLRRRDGSGHPRRCRAATQSLGKCHPISENH